QGEALALMYLSRTLRHQGHNTRASRILVRAEALIESCEDRHGRAILAWEEAAAALNDNRWSDAYRLFMRAGQLFATAGDTKGQALCANGQGEAARRGGNWEDALVCYRTFLDAMVASGHVHGQGLARTNMGWTCLAAQRFQDAHNHFSQAIQILRESQARTAWGDALIGQALALALLNHGERATACLTYASTIVTSSPADQDALQALHRLRAVAHNNGWSTLLQTAETMLEDCPPASS
ncbi:MAG: tetratricopeptide repeat protein, partial [Myxococcota bacterium]